MVPTNANGGKTKVIIPGFRKLLAGGILPSVEMKLSNPVTLINTKTKTKQKNTLINNIILNSLYLS